MKKGGILMRTQFTFNSSTSAYATTNSKENLLYIRYQEKHINDLFKTREYIYLNTIYELLGVKWDPELENLCIIYKPDAEIKLAICKANDDGFDIDIL